MEICPFGQLKQWPNSTEVESHLAALTIRSSQAAISLDHARVYAELARENSERRKAEEALRASEERWRKLFENSSAGIALIVPDGRFLASNLALQKMLGYTEEELDGLTAADLMSAEEHAACEQLRIEAIRGQRRGYRVERRFRRKDGTMIWTDVSGVLVPATGSESAFFAVVIVDINERKRAEEQLRRSEAFLAQGQRISHTGSWGWRVATGEIYWSEEHFRIFEFDPQTNKPSYSLFMERIHPEDRAPFEELLNRAVRDKSDFENNYRIVLPDGSIKFVRSVGQSLVNSSGELEFIGTVMDVTDLKRAEEMQIAIARERETLVRQRALDLAKANEALRGCLDALASVPDLDQFVGQVMARLRCTFRSNLENDENLAAAIRQDLLRITQEAISNALRHAQPTAINVSLRLGLPGLILKVKDNGCGMTTAREIRDGFGFVNMRARVKKLNGSLNIRTASGRGTSIVVTVPVGVAVSSEQ